ncbi:MAG TPA: YggT family protein [Gammaproteobacteria bacterium]|nr:YggT family protein [Gammaproteobacteria bacterium]
MGGYFGNAAVFLIQTVFGLYILAVLLRFLLQWVRADFYNPVSQFLVKMTTPLLRPLRRVIPGFGGIDFASVVLMLALQIIELVLVIQLLGQPLSVGGLMVLAVAGLLSLLIKIFLFSILIQVILSWVRPGDHSPVSLLLYQLNEPLLAPARRIIPAISGLDLSPVLVLVLLQLSLMLLVAPLQDFGMLLNLR